MMANRWILFGMLLGVAACENGRLGNAPGADRAPTDDPDAGSGADDPIEPVPATKRTVIWKRYRAFEQDLVRGLDLAAGELCAELGSLNCVNGVHLASLGGHDPFTQGRDTSLDEPVLTTPLAVERVVLAACIARVNRDATGVPSVFTHYPLSGTTSGSSTEGAQIDAQNEALFRRLLAREALPSELSVLRELAVTGRSFRDVAITSCYVVGTSVEFIFL